MKNKVVVITGGATGMGLAIARELMGNNAIVSIDRNLSKISLLKKNYPKINSIQADVTSSDELNNAINKIDQLFGKIDVLINNAGKLTDFNFINMTEEELMKNIETELSVNYKAPIILIKKALPLLKKSTDPIVAISTAGLAYMPMASIGSYCASKVAAHFITMALRHQLKTLDIKVVEILPPSVDTDLNTAKNIDKMPPEKFAKAFIKKLSQGNDVINIGQSASLEKFSRFFPGMAFKMLNKV